MPLNDLQIKRIKPSDKKQTLSDGGGLALVVNAISRGGTKYFVYNYRFDGKQQSLRIGKYPDIGLAEAREQHQQARNNLAKGINPSQAKQQAVKYRAKLSQGNGELCSKIEPLSVCYKLLRFITQRSPTWMLCMETIAKVHRLFHRQKLSQREIAKQLKLSRNTVAKYLQHTTVEPPVYHREQTHYPKLGPFLDVLTQQLLQEAQLPKQQHLSARRHFERLKDAGYAGQYSAVAVFIRKFRQQHQPKPVPVFMAQAFAPGDAYQFDWSIETVCLAGQTVKVNIAHFRLCHSRAFFVCAYPNQKADMLMDAHNRAFAFFGGVPARGIYDNMKTAVTRIGKGKEREFNAQFLQMMTHFLIEPVACSPASGWEKGQVERQIRHLRERLFKPTLAFDSFTSLNDYLQQQCLRLMQQHKHPEYRQPVNDIWEREKHSLAAFRPYPAERLEILKVSNQSLVTVERHRYSVPVEWAGNTVRVYIGAQTVRFCSDTDCIAEHPRSFVKDGTSYNPWHFLPYLQKKPGALRDGRAFTGWVLPPVIERLKACLLKQPKGDRVMVKLLNLMAEYDADLALTAAELALDEGMPTPEAVLNIINRLKEPPPPRFHIRDIPLTVPPSVDCSRYDRLLSLSGKQTDKMKEKHHAA